MGFSMITIQQKGIISMIQTPTSDISRLDVSYDSSFGEIQHF